MRALRRSAAVFFLMAAISVLPTRQACPHTTLINTDDAWVRVRMDNAEMDYYDVSDASFSITGSSELNCDFTGDGLCVVADLNAMLLTGPVADNVSVTGGVNDQYIFRAELSWLEVRC